MPPPPFSAAEILDKYVKAIQAEQSHPQAVSMDVDMEGKLPRLKKQGRLHAFRFMSRVGKIFYSSQRFEGDNTVKKEVIARYIQAEKDARNGSDGSLAVTPQNYRFRYKGMTDYAGRPAYVFLVNPVKKRMGLYKGELWIDQETFLPLRQWGELVKSPSVFVKNLYFVRDFMLVDGISVPRRLISDITTRIVGKAQLTVWYENVKVGDVAAADTQQIPSTASALLNTDTSGAQADGGSR